MSKKNRIKKLFNPSTYEGFMPNEQHLVDNDLDSECIKSIAERMKLTREEARFKFELWSYG